MAGKYQDQYIGRVTRNQDPLKRGRVKLIVPAVTGPSHETNWAVVQNPSGVDVIPKVGDVVTVRFDGDTPNYPVVTGIVKGFPKGDPNLPREMYDAAPQTDDLNPPVVLGGDTADGASTIAEPRDYDDVEYGEKHLIGGDSGYFWVDETNETVGIEHRSGNRIIVSNDGIKFVSRGKIRSISFEGTEIRTDGFSIDTNDIRFRNLIESVSESPRGDLTQDVKVHKMNSERLEIQANRIKELVKSAKETVVAGSVKETIMQDKTTVVAEYISETIANSSIVTNPYAVAKVVKAFLGCIDIYTLDVNPLSTVNLGGGVIPGVGPDPLLEPLIKATTFFTLLNPLLLSIVTTIDNKHGTSLTALYTAFVAALPTSVTQKVKGK